VKILLSQESVASVPLTGRERLIGDSELPGFVLRVRPSGSKLYAVQYRFRGRLRRMTIGPAEHLSAREARRRARALLGEVAAGIDVALARRRPGTGPTCDEAFEAYCRARNDAGQWRGRTERTYRDDWRLHVSPRIGSLPVDAVELRDCEAIARRAREHHAPKRARGGGSRTYPAPAGGRAAAASSLRLLRAVLNFAERRKWRPRGSNPVLDMDALYKSPRRLARITAEQYAALGRALAEVEGLSPFAVLAVQLLALTGARKGEILSARWEDLDRAAGVLTLPSSKTGPRELVLPRMALDLLAAAPRMVGTPYLCPGRSGGKLGTLDRSFALVRERAGLPSLRVHDLRHGWATVAAELGVAYPLVKAALGHALPDVTGRYTHVAVSALRSPVDVVGAWIAEAGIAPRTATEARAR